MKRADKAERILRILDDLYPEPPIPLDHTDPFTLLVAVLLSAQTTDDRVNLVTPGLFAMARTPAAMAKCSVSEILEQIRSCGLAPGKAKNIKALSEILVREHGGIVPADMDALEALPGVGHKTASVVLIQAFGIPRVSGRHAYPSTGGALGTLGWKERRADRARSEGGLRARRLGACTSLDDLLRSRVLSCARP